MADQLERLNAALADRYTIERELGHGGMATVYLAEDLKHHRKVAVKVLRPDLAAALGSERFMREIEIAANLTHPHIVPLYDSGDADGFLYYVLPYIEGESLRARLAHQGELPIGDAVRILRDIVDALSGAHEHDVVHRDIKPDNVLLTKHHAVVTDFGVAKAVSEATGREKLTTAGVALGTPSYMAPEQAVADPNIDHRVDIYAVGAVAYELLSGRPPFAGTTPQAILSAHVTEAVEPVTKHRPSVPPTLAQLVMRCLEKKPADRWQTAEELLVQLEALATPTGGITPTDTAPIQATAPDRRRPTSKVAASVVALVLVVGAAGIVLMNSEPTTITPGRTTQLTFDPGLELDPAISPDGNMVAYAAGPWGNVHIHLRQVGGGRAIDLTDGLPGNHRWPQWSPDGTQIMFRADPSIYVIPQLGGTPKRLVERGFSPAWLPDGREIIYSVDSTIYVQSIESGDARSIGTDYDPHSFQSSPDGSHIAYVSGNWGYVLGTTILANIAPTTLKTITTTNPIRTALSEKEYVYVSPVWLPDGQQLLYVSNEGGSRDIYQLRVSASGSRAADPLRLTTGLNALTMSLSADGTTLAYSVFRNDANVWSIRIPDRETISIAEAQPVTVGSQTIEGIGVSSDGQWLAFDSNRRGNQDIYRVALPEGEPERLTTDPADDFLPSWSPDGQEILFYSFRYGNRDLFVMHADGSSLQRLTDHPAQEHYPHWAPDGNRIAFQSTETGRYEIHIMSRDGASSDWGTPHQLTSDGGRRPRWSPDGRWIAYIGNQTVKVMSPEGGEPRALVDSVSSGADVVPEFAEWSPDGQTVYYKAHYPDGRASFWSVPVSGGTPHLLVRFDDPSRPSHRYEFATDGERFYFTIGRQESDIWVMELVRPN